MTFDGVQKSASKDCHITGLPYTASPPRNSGDHAYLEGSSSKQTIASPSFHVPVDNINLKMNSAGAGLLKGIAELVCRVEGSEVICQKGPSVTCGNKAENYTKTGTLTLDNKQLKLKMHIRCRLPIFAFIV